MKGYVVCVYKSISNEEKLKEYALKAKAAVEKFKGKFLIRGGRSTANEGEKSPRTVVIEFPTYNEANLFYNSKEYQDAHSVLKGQAVRHHQTIEGA
jgi:uncharacterized protein (DUF1330 family)|tara:strand:+ start:1412 stop:1699 length:288 start_codon:yes stop_codon:yes gene_type:complete